MNYYTRYLFHDSVIDPPRMECRYYNIPPQVAGVAICSKTGNYYSSYYKYSTLNSNYDLELDTANSHLDLEIKQTLWEF